MSIMVSFACNDPDNGAPLGKASAVHIADFELQYTLIGGWGGVKLSYQPGEPGRDGKLKVGRITVPCLYQRCWLENWCWDGYAVPLESATEIVNYLMKQKYWHCERGECNVFDKFNAKRPINKAELLAAVGPKPKVRP